MQLGDAALEGKEEYLPSHLFDPVDHDRWITGKGTLIMVFDPKAAENTSPFWEHEKTTEEGKSRVPKGFKVKVIDGSVKMTKSAAG